MDTTVVKWVFFVNPKSRRIGCSADGIASNYKDFKMKFSYSKNEACDDKNFLMGLIDGVARLRNNTTVILNIKVLWLLLAQRKLTSFFTKMKHYILKQLNLSNKKCIRKLYHIPENLGPDFQLSGFILES